MPAETNNPSSVNISGQSIFLDVIQPPTPLSSAEDLEELDDDQLHLEKHIHYVHRAPWLRAAVLGANDGLLSTTATMLGIGAVSPEALLLAGLVTLAGGSLSMAIGEYVSVASQYDMEKSDIERERAEHAKGPEVVARETEELVRIYIKRGLSRPLAKEVVKELHAKDAVGAHVRDELGIDVDGLSNPWVAAFSSMAAFAVGSAWPVAAAAIVPAGTGRIIAVIVVVIVMLCIFGATGAYIGGASLWRAGIRVCIGGSIAMGLAYGAGWLAKNKLGLNVHNG